MRRAARQDGMTLGSLCRRQHRHDGADRSMRYASGHCVACFKLALEVRMRDQAKKAHAEQKRKAREAINRPAKGRPRKTIEDQRASDAAAKRRARVERADEVRARQREYYEKNDLKVRLRNRVSKAFRQQGANKPAVINGHYVDVPAIVAHLGPRPGSGKDWHIDHIRPLASFDLRDPAQVAAAMAPSNHQWLPAIENIKKGARYG